jgi:hypothetical protein
VSGLPAIGARADACGRSPTSTEYQRCVGLLEMVPKPWDDPTLEVFVCRVKEGEFHYHLGHAKGKRAKFLRHKAERMRRKALIAALEGSKRPA